MKKVKILITWCGFDEFCFEVPGETKIKAGDIIENVNGYLCCVEKVCEFFKGSEQEQFVQSLKNICSEYKAIYRKEF